MNHDDQIRRIAKELSLQKEQAIYDVMVKCLGRQIDLDDEKDKKDIKQYFKIISYPNNKTVITFMDKEVLEIEAPDTKDVDGKLHYYLPVRSLL